MNLNPNYSESYALIVGINDYKEVSPLHYAVSDANEVAKTLVEVFNFEENKVCTLLNEEATGENIIRKYLSYASQEIHWDDRLIFFFAGHGYTLTSRRGEVGFLVPYDGDTADISTLLRWDQLTRNADLIPAKHILFIMDACYGGLALTRSLQPGSVRFLKDMLLRVSRQVITAGKADEVVSDVGGPREGHSIFTAHLLDALEGKAEDSEGILTANSIMAYVYRQVGHDPDSNQTPHFGYLDGDGDLIFSAPMLSELTKIEEEDQDILFEVPFSLGVNQEVGNMSVVEKTKELISDPKLRINLYDLVVDTIRKSLSETDDELFPVEGSLSPNEFAERLKKYEEATSDLVSIEALLGFWAENEHLDIMTLPLRRFAGRIQPVSGQNVWSDLRWYPILLFTYSAGIAATASGKYNNLRELFLTPISDPRIPSKINPLITSLFSGIGNASEYFKNLPGHEKHFVPRSEYLYKHLQPSLDDLLFLGSEYDATFDRFELLLALVHAHENVKQGHGVWGPVGRFGWKQRAYDGGPLTKLVKEANNEGKVWAPFLAGFFDGSLEDFLDIATTYSEMIGKLGWH